MKRLFSRLFASRSNTALARADRLLAAGNPARAFEWLSRAALAGSPKAQFRVGQAYVEAAGVPRSLPDAAAWFEKAAAAGHAEAQARLAAHLTA